MQSDDPIARIQSTESCGAVDGPGLRYIVFFQGCQFKCKYCHNRDTWSMAGGIEKPLSEMLREIKSYLAFYRPNGGGVTASGGEATLQSKFVARLFSEVKKMGLTTCLDSNGCVARYDGDIDELLKVTDLVLLDLKHMDPAAHKILTGKSNELTIKFALELKRRGIPMWIRYVVVPGISDSEDNVRALGRFVRDELGDAAQFIDVLPYHTLGVHKWSQYGDKYELDGVEPPSAESIAGIKKILTEEFSLAVR